MGQLFSALGGGLNAVGNSLGNFMQGGGLLGHLFGAPQQQGRGYVPGQLDSSGGQQWGAAQNPNAQANGVNQMGIGSYLSHLFGGS